MRYLFFSTLFVLLEAVAYLIILRSTLKPREQQRIIANIITTIVLICVSNTLISLLVVNNIVKGLFVVVTNVLIGYIFYRSTTFILFYIITFVYVLLITADALLLVGLSFFSMHIHISTEPTMLEFLVTIFPKIAVIFVLLLLKRYFFAETIVAVPPKTPMLFSVCLMLVNVVIVIQLARTPLENRYTTILSTLALVTMDLLLYYFMEQSYRWAREEANNVALRQQISYQSSHINEMTVVYDKQKRFVHDYRNNIVTIRQLIKDEKYDEVKNYITNLSSDLTLQSYEYHTGHDLIDAILNVKGSDAKSRHIQFTVQLNITASGSIAHAKREPPSRQK